MTRLVRKDYVVWIFVNFVCESLIIWCSIVDCFVCESLIIWCSLVDGFVCESLIIWCSIVDCFVSVYFPFNSLLPALLSRLVLPNLWPQPSSSYYSRQQQPRPPMLKPKLKPRQLKHPALKYKYKGSHFCKVNSSRLSTVKHSRSRHSQ